MPADTAPVIQLRSADAEPATMLQSAGIAVLVDADETILGFTDNWLRLAGTPLQLGARLGDRLGDGLAGALLHGDDDSVMLLEAALNDRDWLVHVLRSPQHRLIELLPFRSDSTNATWPGLQARVDDGIEALEQSDNLYDLCQYCCELTADLLGARRVTLLRLDANGSSEVIAEDASETLLPWMGLRLPADYWPVSTQDMATSGRPLLLTDINEPGTAMQLEAGSQSGCNNLLRRAWLRGDEGRLGPLLQAHEASSALLIGIPDLDDDSENPRAWGMLLAEHDLPHAPLALGAAALTELTMALGRRISQLSLVQAQRQSLRLALSLPAIKRALREESQAVEALFLTEPGLMTLSGAHGLAFVCNGVAASYGSTPPLDWVLGLAEWISRRKEPVYCNDALMRDYPGAAEHSSTASGVAATLIYEVPLTMVLCFRGEIGREVTWSGAPLNNLAQPSLAPSAAFARWLEASAGRARPWEPSVQRLLTRLACELPEQVNGISTVRHFEDSINELALSALPQPLLEALFERISLSGADLVAAVDNQGYVRFAQVSQVMYQSFGLVAANLRDREFVNLLEQLELDSEVLNLPLGQLAEVESWSPSSGQMVLELRHEGLIDIQVSGNQQQASVFLIRDITESRRVEVALASARDELALSEGRFRRITDNIPGAVYEAQLTDDGLLCHYLSQGAGELLGLPDNQLQKHLDLISLIHVEDRERVLLSLQQAASNHRTWIHEFRVRAGNDELKWLRASARARIDGDGHQLFDGVLLDITARRSAEARLQHVSQHDPLTDLPNRKLFLSQLRTISDWAARLERKVAVLVVDIDHFSNVNNSHGEDVGDELLVAVARRLRHRLRSADMLARLDGNRFGIILGNAPQQADAEGVAKRMLAAFQQSWDIGNLKLTLSASVGMTIRPGQQDGENVLLADALLAMSHAKSTGGNRYQWFDPSLRQRAQRYTSLRDALARDPATQGFHIAYQPKFPVTGGSLVGVEALLRWQHPELGPIGPSEFIPLAEDTGAILPLTRWLVEETTKQLALWRRDEPALRLSLNLSRSDLGRSDLALLLIEALKDNALPPDALEVEIPEDIAMRPSAVHLASFKALGEAGVGIAVDDFGSGFAALSNLRHITRGQVKIDPRFIHGLGKNKGDEAVVKAAIGIAHAFGLEAIAEGVETAGQLESLQLLGCDLAQGFHLGYPQAAERIDELIKPRT